MGWSLKTLHQIRVEQLRGVCSVCWNAPSTPGRRQWVEKHDAPYFAWYRAMNIEKLFCRCVLFTVLVWIGGVATRAQNNRQQPQESSTRPNILLIITDDQGYGDLGVHGNPKLRTPNLDRLASESVVFQSFYVSPVCSPTRSSLLTGRYNYRTGVVDTYLGRSLMHPDEVTLAEMLATAGYRTGIFGKWHLGDNYPMRAIDQGFQEALTLNGGGIGQPSDPAGGESYFDPILFANGNPQKTPGYVSDVITSASAGVHRAKPQPAFLHLRRFQCATYAARGSGKVLSDLPANESQADRFPKCRTSLSAEFRPGDHGPNLWHGGKH